MLTFAVIFSQLAGVATAASVSADKEGISWRSIEGYARKNSDWLKSDWVGRFILEGYLFGQWVVPGVTPTKKIYLEGKSQSLPVLDIYNTPAYGKDSANKYYGPYMMKNPYLRLAVQSILSSEFSKIKNGTSRSINISKHVDMENGEQIIGYQYLHGTNSAVGDFTIKGTAKKDSSGNVDAQLFFEWNDVIDPNFQYDTDKIKAQIAKQIPGAKPTNYIIKIGWDYKVRKM
jgi:hypothetical protein